MASGACWGKISLKLNHIPTSSPAPSAKPSFFFGHISLLLLWLLLLMPMMMLPVSSPVFFLSFCSHTHTDTQAWKEMGDDVVQPPPCPVQSMSHRRLLYHVMSCRVKVPYLRHLGPGAVLRDAEGPATQGNLGARGRTADCNCVRPGWATALAFCLVCLVCLAPADRACLALSWGPLLSPS